MDKIVKQSIDIRHDVFTNTYEINDNELIKKINDLFQKINELGEKSIDAMDFENKFSVSPLNKEYSDLLMEVGSKCKAKAMNEITYEEEKKPTIVDDTKRIAKRRIRDKIDSEIRNTPLGKIEQIDNMRYLFKRLGKK